ncbi:MAG: helix-turn-helix domain-containing protein [Pseudonocardiales bacterium]|nr:helix-turn-helix domain-containing protein [Pseudonocardiales bacterium]
MVRPAPGRGGAGGARHAARAGGRGGAAPVRHRPGRPLPGAGGPRRRRHRLPDGPHRGPHAPRARRRRARRAAARGAARRQPGAGPAARRHRAGRAAGPAARRPRHAARHPGGGLLDLPPADRDTLLVTLEELLACGGSPTHAATALFCHRNTVIYRMRRIEAATGRRLADTRDRLLLTLALMAVRRGG